MGNGRGRRLGIRVVACVIIGALGTLAVAWSCAVWGSGSLRPRAESGYSGTVRGATDWLGARLRPVMPPELTSMQDDAPLMISWWSRSGAGVSYDRMLLNSRGEVPQLVIVRAGLPLRCVWAYSWLDNQGFIASMSSLKPLRYEGGIEPPGWLRPVRASTESWPPGPMPIATRFIVKGFALNTAFFAAIAFVLWSAPALVRRRVRRARGHCSACGYDLKGAKLAECPECGARREGVAEGTGKVPSASAHEG